MVRWSITQNKQQVGYNAKGEVVSADHSTTNAFDRSFDYDGIGNRKKSVDGLDLTDPSATSYTANALNQLTAVGTTSRVHDADGNITDNGEHLYVWDAENRLIEVQKKSDSSTVATYAYDFQSRRITKTVGSTVTNFVYDGWNPIAEFSGTTLSKSYVWGMDISGSIEGAGGVGGLLAVNDTTATYYPTFDGNGNVSEYVDSTGTPVAHYEYDAFGQAVASGTKANDFTHQFSTKQLDTETGLHYYGYRYYDSSNGRWLGRDPLAEESFFTIYTKNYTKKETKRTRLETFNNLYGFVENSCVNHIDVKGLVLGWGYGNWCGYSRAGQNGAPIDEVDQACRDHDFCLARLRDAFKFKCCNLKFLKKVLKADCRNSPNKWKCRRAKAVILGPGGIITIVTPFV